MFRAVFSCEAKWSNKCQNLEVLETGYELDISGKYSQAQSVVRGGVPMMKTKFRRNDQENLFSTGLINIPAATPPTTTTTTTNGTGFDAKFDAVFGNTVAAPQSSGKDVSRGPGHRLCSFARCLQHISSDLLSLKSLTANIALFCFPICLLFVHYVFNDSCYLWWFSLELKNEHILRNLHKIGNISLCHFGFWGMFNRHLVSVFFVDTSIFETHLASLILFFAREKFAQRDSFLGMRCRVRVGIFFLVQSFLFFASHFWLNFEQIVHCFLWNVSLLFFYLPLSGV